LKSRCSGSPPKVSCRARPISMHVAGAFVDLAHAHITAEVRDTVCESDRLEAIDHARGIVVRLEPGRMGVAVELCAGEDMPRYVVRLLVRALGNRSSMATDT